MALGIDDGDDDVGRIDSDQRILLHLPTAATRHNDLGNFNVIIKWQRC